MMSDLLDISKGIRFVGYWNEKTGNQYPVRTREDIYRIIDEHLGVDNIGISMCAYKDNKSILLFLPFDFDSSNLKLAWLDAIKLYNHFVRCGLDTHLTFSGRKGFHVFLAVKPKHYNKKKLRQVQEYFKENFNLKTMDTRIFGDIRRLMRIPHTYNINGTLCRVISKQDGKQIDLDDIIISKEVEEVEYDSDAKFHKYPCVERLIRDKDYWYKHHPRGKFEPAQPIRFCWVALQLSKGFDTEDIINMAEKFNWEDYDEYKTRQQIEHIASHGYAPYSCYSLRSMGYCFPDCIFRNKDNELKERGIKC